MLNKTVNFFTKVTSPLKMSVLLAKSASSCKSLFRWRVLTAFYLTLDTAINFGQSTPLCSHISCIDSDWNSPAPLIALQWPHTELLLYTSSSHAADGRWSELPSTMTYPIRLFHAKNHPSDSIRETEPLCSLLSSFQQDLIC